MFCLFDYIYFCGVNELESLNLTNFNYILNCSINLNNLIISPNYINLNLNQPIQNLIPYIIQSLEFILNCLNNKNKIILLDETGKDDSIIVGIMFLMKIYNKNFNSIYDSISNYTQIHPKEYYSSIMNIEYYLIGFQNQYNGINTTQTITKFIL